MYRFVVRRVSVELGSSESSQYDKYTIASVASVSYETEAKPARHRLKFRGEATEGVINQSNVMDVCQSRSSNFPYFLKVSCAPIISPTAVRRETLSSRRPPTACHISRIITRAHNHASLACRSATAQLRALSGWCARRPPLLHSSRGAGLQRSTRGKGVFFHSGIGHGGC